MRPIISFEGVSLGYGSRVVLPQIDLKVQAGDFLAILGPNGSGKTTILRAILGILKPLKGSVTAPLNCGYSPQRRALDPIFPFTVEEVVAMGLVSELGPLRRPGPRERTRVRRALEACGVLKLSERAFRELSGGQQQRTLVARALVTDPEVLILDEPTNDLDLTGEHEIMELIAELNETGRTVVMVSHLLNVVAHYATSVVVLHGGQLQAGEASQVLTSERLTRLYGIDVLAELQSGRRVIVPKPIDRAARRAHAAVDGVASSGTHEALSPKRRRRARPVTSFERTAALAAAIAVKLLPRDVAAELGEAAGVAAGWFSRARWEGAGASLEHALPQATPRKRARVRARSFRNAGRGVVEALRLSLATKHDMERSLEVEGLERLQRARAEGGVLVVGARLNGDELLPAVVRRLSRGRVSVLEDRPTGRLSPAVRAIRLALGLETLSFERGAKEAQTRLLRGETVVLLVDRNSATRHAVFVPFLGQPAATSTRAASLALETNAAIVPAVITRAGVDRYRLQFHPAVRSRDAAPSEDEAILETTRECTRILETAVRARPDEWRWDLDRWRTRPRARRAFPAASSPPAPALATDSLPRHEVDRA